MKHINCYSLLTQAFHFKTLLGINPLKGFESKMTFSQPLIINN